MTKLLFIKGSPRGKESKSNALARQYIERLQAEQPEIIVEEIDLWQANLPEFDGDKSAAKMTFFGVGEMNAQKQSAWDDVVEICQKFIQADHYVISAPMWNGSISYKLKQYIDIATQPGLLFGFAPDTGYSGLLENKKATVFYTSGVYAPNIDAKYGSDYHSTYLSWWLDMIGVQDVESIRFQPSLLTADAEADFEKVKLSVQNLR